MELDVVVVCEPESTPTKNENITITRKRSNSQDLAKQAVQLLLGTDNDYLQRLLTNKLDGREKKYKRIPLTQVVRRDDRSKLRATLQNASSTSQLVAVEVLNKFIAPDIEMGQPVQKDLDLDKNQAITSWVLNTVLQEKLKDREMRESADYWKYINGGLAVLLPIITGLLDHFLTSYLKKCECNSG